MKISTFEMYHGAVLAKVLRKGMSIKLVEIAKEASRGEYIVEDDHAKFLLYIKHRSKVNKLRRKRGVRHCHFTLTSDDVARLSTAEKMHGKNNVRLVLVCGEEGICLLKAQELEELVQKTNSSNWVKVGWAKDSQFTVMGSNGKELRNKPPRNRLKNLFVAKEIAPVHNRIGNLVALQA